VGTQSHGPKAKQKLWQPGCRMELLFKKAVMIPVAGTPVTGFLLTSQWPEERLRRRIKNPAQKIERRGIFSYI